MRRLLVLIPLALAPFTGGQRLNDGAVQAAVNAGLQNKLKPFVAACTTGPDIHAPGSLDEKWLARPMPLGPYTVTLSTNRGRIALLAAEARRRHRPFAAADVAGYLREPGVFLAAEPERPGLYLHTNTYYVPPPAHDVLLRSRRAPDFWIKPLRFEATPVEWQRSMRGGSVLGTRLAAVFVFEAVAGLPAGDIEVVIVTNAGERTCWIAAKSRAKLFD